MIITRHILDNDRYRFCLPVDLSANRLGTNRTQIFVFVAFWEHNQKAFTDWNGTLARRAIQLCRIKLLEHSIASGLLSICTQWACKVFRIHCLTLSKIFNLN
jgi:hypothetical protein